MVDYCSRHIETMGIDAEGPFVYIGVIFVALGCFGLTVLLDRRSDVNLMFLESKPDSLGPLTAPVIPHCVHLLLRPGHYDLLLPNQQSKMNGEPSLSASDLSNLCNRVKIEVIQPMELTSVSAATLDTSARSLICQSVVVHYPSLQQVLPQISADLSVSSLLNCLPRVTIESNFRAVYCAGGILRMNYFADHPVDSFLALQGTVSELILASRRDFGIPAHYQVYLNSQSSTDSKIVMCIAGFVRVNIEFEFHCEDIENSSYCILDLNQLTDFDSLAQCIFSYFKIVTADCYLYPMNGVLTDLWDLSVEQEQNPELEMTLTVRSGLTIIVCNHREEELNRLVFRPANGLPGLREALANCLKIPQRLPIEIRVAPSYEVLLDSNIHLMTDKCNIQVLFCSSCLKKFPLASRRESRMFPLSSCSHTLCEDCMGQLLDVSKRQRKKLGFEFFSDGQETDVYSLHQSVKLGPLPLPEICSAYDNLPSPVEILCPECSTRIMAENINEHPIYLSDFTSAIEEIEQYISNVRSFRKCYLSKLDICDDGLEPIDRLMQLGCDHFFHKCCLSHYLKCEIDKAKMEPTEPLMCIECQNEHHCCGCMTCSGVLRKDTENRGHIITEQEVSTLVACPSANFSEVNKDHWDRVQSTITATRIPGMSLIRCNKCESFFCIDREQDDEDIITCPYATCSYKLCTQCKLEAHPSKSCKENKKEIKRRELASLNLQFLQDCPFCDNTWSVPIECLHVKCEKLADGCERQFCFLCAASHTPTLYHGNWYHRPQCTFYNIQCDCEPLCLESNELAVCVKSRYWPGPCHDCKLAGSINTCTHSDWRPCGDCNRNRRDCTHWCDECFRKGSLCTPPGNPKIEQLGGLSVFKYQVFPHKEVEREQQLLSQDGAAFGVEHK